MTAERWQRIKEIFQSARDRVPADREAYLSAETAGDAELRREVEKLLRFATGAGPLDRPAWEQLPADCELAAGARLGPYQILAQAGSGGMGRVYKALDTRLGRTVAVKVLNAEFSHRLRTEGRAISALNHPHVCALYDIGDQQGAAYLVMEYVQGESLAACLARGPLPLDAVLRYGAEIAGALAAAHARGIVHRDLKPANIMITASGAKVLDFGVARMAQDEETCAGAVVGTAAYMSPSQLNGSPADARSDIFALGLVICEMATGARPSSQAPKSPEGLPAGLASLIGRCLRYEGASRVQHMEEVRQALERLRSESTRPARPSWTRPAATAALLAVAAAAAVLTWRVTAFSPPPQPRPPAVASIASGPITPVDLSPVPTRKLPPADAPTIPVVMHARPVPPSLGTLASYPGTLARDPSFSPDGSTIAFAWKPPDRGGYSVSVKPLDWKGLPRRLTQGDAEDWGPAWSPDGRKIAFRRRAKSWGIYWIPSSGGPEYLVAPIAHLDQETLPQMSWTRDGKWIAAPDRDLSGATRIYLFSIATGERRELTFNSSGTDHAPAFSPDGKSLAYASCLHGAADCDVILLDVGRDLVAKHPRRVTDRGIYLRGITWLPDGRSLVYAAGSKRSDDTSLWRLPVNPPGIPERIDIAGSSARHPTISQTGGLLAYTRLANWSLMMVRDFR